MNNVIYFYDFNAFAKYYQDPFIANLIKNEEFCKQFVKTFMDLANYNFNKDLVIEKTI